MSLLEQIDALREESNRLIEERRALDREREEEFCHCGEEPQWIWDVREKLAQVRRSIDRLLAQYHNLPRCPFCRSKMERSPGLLMSNPPQEELRCDRCHSIARRTVR